jgi:chromosomal replication initiation ATPase DnaA
MNVLIRRKDRIDYILNGVCEYYNVTLDELKGRYRTPAKVNRKRIAIMILKDIGDISFTDIAKIFSPTNPKGYYMVYWNYDTLVGDLQYDRELQSHYKDILKHMGL